MPNNNNHQFQDKLPQRNWVIRFSGIFIVLLIAILVISLYRIQIPSFTLLELHQVPTNEQTIAIAPKEAVQQFTIQQTIDITLENGHIAKFKLLSIKTNETNIQLTLIPLPNDEKITAFLQEEYISTGKMHTGSKPLIWSLLSI